MPQGDAETTIEGRLNKKYEGLICRITGERKEVLKLFNHTMGHRRLYLQLRFRNVTDLLTARHNILPLALANGAKHGTVDACAEVISTRNASTHSSSRRATPFHPAPES